MILQQWFRWWLGAHQATSHFLNEWWLFSWSICASLGLSELINCSYDFITIYRSRFFFFYSFSSSLYLYLSRHPAILSIHIKIRHRKNRVISYTIFDLDHFIWYNTLYSYSLSIQCWIFPYRVLWGVYPLSNTRNQGFGHRKDLFLFCNTECYNWGNGRRMCDSYCRNTYFTEASLIFD